MAAPRFLSKLGPKRAAAAEEKLRAIIAAGQTVDQLDAWARAEGLDVSRATLANFRREVLGAAAEDPDARLRRLVQQEAQAVAERAPAPPTDAPAADEAPINHEEILRTQLGIARAIAEDESGDVDSKTKLAAAKLVLEFLAELRKLKKEGQVAQGPRIVAYVPTRRTLSELEAE